MTPELGARRFEVDDPEAQRHFDERGFVIVSGVLDDADLELVGRGWERVVQEASSKVELEPTAFVEKFPQNRDLWRKAPEFEDLLLRRTRQPWAAQRFLGVSGVRLFHDHAICKPAHRSGTIPWHQDSAYWPFDRVGISLWSPTFDVHPDGGCLEVLEGSHRDGPGAPQDFLASGGAIRRDDPRLVALPVRRGETVVLHGLTWHGSGPNVGARDRLAYLTLWVPATARFVPEHAGWHPSAAHVEVGPGERLDGPWFPLFGAVSDVDEGTPIAFPLPRRSPGAPSMFSASRDIAAQIAWLLDERALGMGELLGPGRSDRVIRAAIATGLMPAKLASELEEVLADLELQERVRRESTARDVYLRVVDRWWRLLGAQIAEARGGP